MRKFLKRNKKALISILSIILFLSIGFLGWRFLHQKETQKLIKASFELKPSLVDSSGIDPKTSFILKSDVDLNPDTIKKILSFKPEVDFDVKKISAKSSEFEIKPKEELQENNVYRLLIGGPLAVIATTREYSWAYQVKAPFQVISTLPRDKGSHVPTNTGIEITFNRDGIINPEKYFKITPSVNGSFEIHRDLLIFIPKGLKEKTLYTVTIKKGLKTKGSNDILEEDYQFQFETEEKYQPEKPYFKFERNFLEFRPEIEPIIEVSSSNLNVSDLEFNVYQFKDIDAFITAYKDSVDWSLGWAYYYSSTYLPKSEKKILTFKTNLEKSDYRSFIRFPQKLEEGYYLIDIVVNNTHQQSWFQVTNIASYLALSGQKSLIWLYDFKTQKPFSNANISLVDNPTFKTQSNSQGLAIFETPEMLIEDFKNEYYFDIYPRYFFKIETSQHEAYLLSITDKWGYPRKASKGDFYWDYFSCDRKLYKPTDTIKFWGIIKGRKENLQGKEVTVQLKESYYGQYWSGKEETFFTETKVKITPFNTISGELSFSNIKPGYYPIVVKLDNKEVASNYVSIQTYQKPAYILSLIPSKSAIFAGETINYKVKAEFFDGTPVSNLKVKFSGYWRKTIEGEIKLNEFGEGSFNITPSYFPREYWPTYFDVSLSPIVAEEGEIIGESSVLVFGPKINIDASQEEKEDYTQIKVKLNEIVLDKINKESYNYSIWDYLGGPIVNHQINGRTYELIDHKKKIGQEYDYINKVTIPIYEYLREEKLVNTFKGKTDNNGEWTYSQKLDQNKRYKIVLFTKDKEGREAENILYAYGKGVRYYWGGEELYLKDINEDKRGLYNINDEIKLKLERREGELAEEENRFLFYRFQNGIDEAKVISKFQHEEVFKEEYIPNIRFIGVWFSPYGFKESNSVNISFNAEKRRLDIDVKTDKENYKPGEGVEIFVKVTDRDGNLKKAEVNLSAIDEALYSLYPDENDIINTLYEDIWISPITRSSHYMLEKGAEAGGGEEVREKFLDRAFYTSIVTDNNGEARVSFKLPDNITSWRLTTQAVTEDLFAGKSVSFIKVTLPFFVEATLNEYYLTNDEPILRIRAFGEKLKGQKVKFNVKSESLKLDISNIQGDKEGRTEVNLGKFKKGIHRIKIEAEVGSLKDSIIREIKVVSSYLTRDKAEYYKLSPNLKDIKGNSEGYTTLVFSSLERGRPYPYLKSLSYASGIRVDQILAKEISQELLNDYFDEKGIIFESSVSEYQTEEGGISLLPYSDNDLELSVKIANLAKERFYENELKKYFYDSLKGKKADIHRLSQALYGLSNLGEPVLTKIQILKEDPNLTLKDKIYIGLALYNFGAKEDALKIYSDEIKPKIKFQEPYAYIKISQDKDEIILTTGLAVILAENLNQEESLNLSNYLFDNPPKRNLSYLEQLLYIKETLENLKGDRVQFSYQAGEKSGKEVLEKGQTFRLILSPEELKNIQFSDIKGEVGVVSFYEEEYSIEEISPDEKISIKRDYLLNNRSKREFKEGDIIKIRLDPKIAEIAFEGDYQVIDYLPSGFKPVTRIYERELSLGDECNPVWYPTQIENQKISFRIWKGFNKTKYCSNRTINYYARVISKGSYRAEPTTIQSLKSLSSINFSLEDKIKIK